VDSVIVIPHEAEAGLFRQSEARRTIASGVRASGGVGTREKH